MFNIIKKLLAMGLPMAASRFIHTFNTFIVMVLIAQLGHEALAASFTIAMTRIVMLVIFLSPLFAIGAIVGRKSSQVRDLALSLVPPVTAAPMALVFAIVLYN